MSYLGQNGKSDIPIQPCDSTLVFPRAGWVETDPPQNSHLNVKIAKNLTFLSNLFSKNSFFFSKKLTMAIFLEKLQFLAILTFK